MVRKTKFPIRICLRCLKEFEPAQWNQLYCGSKSAKEGCSWYNASIERGRRRGKTEVYKSYQRKYQQEWKKEQRRLDTDYAKRQRECKSEYSTSDAGKAVTKRWRQKNPEVILRANRRRKLKKMNVFGSHTQEEWESRKRSFGYKCAHCEISESDLSEKYPDIKFHRLTRDHIIPISKGGTDFLSNIQPLCIGCNAKKHDAFELKLDTQPWASIVTLNGFDYIRESLGKIVCTSLPADPIHPGHLSCLKESCEYGDSLVVIVNGDWFLKNKKGHHFMPLEMRSQIVAGFKWVDVVVPFEIENDMTVCEALKVIRPHVFTKGGDRSDPRTIPEWEVCEDYGIQIVTGVGDSKVHSSSNILEDWYNRRLRMFIP
jgi:cytidyltransferase-like protein